MHVMSVSYIEWQQEWRMIIRGKGGSIDKKGKTMRVSVLEQIEQKVALCKSAEHSPAQWPALSKPIRSNLIYSSSQWLSFIKDCVPHITVAISVQTQPTAEVGSVGVLPPAINPRTMGSSVEYRHKQWRRHLLPFLSFDRNALQ